MIVEVAGRDNILAWGKDIDLFTKVGERGEHVIFGGCTDGDGLSDTSWGKVARVLLVISGRNNDRDALANGAGNLWNTC